MRRFALSFVAVAGGLALGFCSTSPCWAQTEPVLIDRFRDPLSESGFGRPTFPGFNGPVLQPVCAEEPMPADAQALLKVYDADIVEIQKKADGEKRQRREKAIAALQELQDKYTREAKLDEAVAIRDRIRRLKMADLPIFRDPGSLYQFQSQIGKSFLFEVVGSLDGSLWGTEVYTGDSTLAKAAVHMGVLKSGQKGVVKVTIIESPAEHKGSIQNGVSSSSYGHYSFSYTVEPFREPAKPQ